MTPVGFEPTIPASERSQTDALDRATTGICQISYFYQLKDDEVYGEYRNLVRKAEESAWNN
jgi:hypothetical protein